ncbi:dTDP-4-dehydrorhamnose reductase [Patescibacteria group bacterium]|nr:dTDP-4-dehydrorhamnose reductase [Patescibacteria group bacterium]MBU1663039.1 dTDP-4-dehydrorhamnose reductase [Patescibacteria group bacterium]MBU1934121.1 dTDP-4-dehydrorhamnose reductase [Patescibacteria group bacterium]MBU2007910.1 dTDP-4-dehydrorhamnose reductase [Patescibacteria group bacterium]MBU2233520.1 dTDP-4-dehydrorhamnose reductase [Patescibacteria group bacterium]
MAKILILGAKGNLGQQLQKVFAVNNEIIAWDRGEIDISDQELILKKISDIRPELVINAAAYNAVDKCEADDQEYELAKKVNIDGPKFLAQACLKVDAILIHYSTDYVFDGAKKGGYKETDEPKPINRYGKTKFHGEKKILELSGSGLKWYLIRTSKLFGAKAENEMAKPSFFDIILEQGRTKPSMEIVDEEIGCFTYTPDLAKATRELVDHNHDGYGIYHLTNSGSCTWYEAALELFNLAGVEIEVKPIASDKLARPAKRPKYSVLLNTKLAPLRGYREALKEYLKLNFI